jgi:hypothetical protein
MVSANTPEPSRPTAPDLSAGDLWKQFWADAYGKEVQTAATYSYTWLADQFGHICIGILADFLATLVSGWVVVQLGWRAALGYDTGLWPGLFLAVIGVSLWECSAYFSSVKQATGTFPLDKKLLRDNAVIAAVYMSLGALLGFAFHLDAIWALVIATLVVVAAVMLAPSWLRQKITWQKASIPYLFRLADAAPTIGRQDANTLLALINGDAPSSSIPACQVIIGGPIGSGRTSMAAGIATEFAFRKNKVRYLSLDSLVEFAVAATGGPPFPDDFGPTTISYWPWSEAQVLIIDDVGPMIASNEPQRQANLARFTGILNNELASIGAILKQCHTVWVVGDLRPPFASGTLSTTLDDFAKAIARYCGNKRDPLVIELGSPADRIPPKGALLRTARRAAQTATVSNIREVARSRE